MPLIDHPADQIVLWGAGGHAKVVIDALCEQRRWKLVGLLDDIHSERKGSRHYGCTILGAREQLLALRSTGTCAFAHVAVGDGMARLRLAGEMLENGFSLATIIHPHCQISATVQISAGSFLAAGAVVAADTRLGRCVIVNTCASIDHDCVLEDGVHVGPGARLTGHIHVGQCALIGAGAVVLPRLRIGAESIVGAGSVVCSNVDDGAVVAGNPAHPISRRMPHV